jgi:hypothetical protein
MKKIMIAMVFLVLWQVSYYPSMAASPPIIWSFEISATTVSLGEAVSVYWIVIAADQVTIDNGIGDVGLAGGGTIFPTECGTVTVTLSATNAAGTSVVRKSFEVVEFVKYFNGSGWDDAGYCVQPTFDGGYIMTGVFRTKSSGGEDIVLLKTDAHGNLLWRKTFGGTGTDIGYFVQQTFDGGFIIAGESAVNNLIRTDATGNIIWAKKFVWPLYYLYCVRQTADGGFVVGASKGHLFKTDALGNLLWDQQYAGTDKIYSVSLTSEGGFILTGAEWHSNALVDEMFLVKTDVLGNFKWRKQFGGTDWDRGFAVVEASGGGYIVAGTKQIGGGYDAFWLVKTNSAGNVVWNRTFANQTGNLTTKAYSVVPTADGGAVGAGCYEVWGPEEQDVYIVRVDGEGNLVWSKIIAMDGYEAARCIADTPDGRFIITGTADTEYTAGDDVLLMKFK